MKKENTTIHPNKLNLYALPLFFIITACMMFVFFLEFTSTKEIADCIIYFARQFKFWNVIFIVIFFIIHIVIHELLHGITWSFYCNNGFKDIKFGVVWKQFIPYCNCKSPLLIMYYKLGVIMPFIVTGILPLIISIFFNSQFLIFVSYFSMITSIGDLIIYYFLLKEPKSVLILDHPILIGYTKLVLDDNK